ncbi:Spy/CpxP family protein refolding chaperone [Polaromonas sp.]|uniref:Spy/CpxP family protein refolding chaperone n=1 Tax=Polaromonas sp. TaxID=1869339 RepID=UPI003BB4DF53
MKFALKSLNGLVLAGLLASAGAMAQGTDASPASLQPGTAATASPQYGGHRMERHDPAKMQAWMARHQAELKAKLKITPAQEGAWTTFTASMQPPARMMGEHPGAEQRAELDKLTTPERIDKMRALRTQRMTEMTAEMDKRGEATKAFYAALSPEQQKTFDAEHRKMGQHGGPGQRAGGMGMMHPKN